MIGSKRARLTNYLPKLNRTTRVPRWKFGTIDSTEKTIAILGDRRWPQTATEERYTISRTFSCVIYGRNVLSAGVYIGSKNGAPSRKGCVVNGTMTKASIIIFFFQVFNSFCAPFSTYHSPPRNFVGKPPPERGNFAYGTMFNNADDFG